MRYAMMRHADAISISPYATPYDDSAASACFDDTLRHYFAFDAFLLIFSPFDAYTRCALLRRACAAPADAPRAAAPLPLMPEDAAPLRSRGRCCRRRMMPLMRAAMPLRHISIHYARHYTHERCADADTMPRAMRTIRAR